MAARITRRCLMALEASAVRREASESPVSGAALRRRLAANIIFDQRRAGLVSGVIRKIIVHRISTNRAKLRSATIGRLKHSVMHNMLQPPTRIERATGKKRQSSNSAD